MKKMLTKQKTSNTYTTPELGIKQNVKPQKLAVKTFKIAERDDQSESTTDILYENTRNKYLRCLNCSLIPSLTLDVKHHTINIDCKCGVHNTLNITDYLEKGFKNNFNNQQCFLCQNKIDFKNERKNFFCQECNGFFCKNCIKKHEIQNSKHHTITLDKFDTYCILHKESNDYYCNTCQENICQYCFDEIHSKHNVVDLDDINLKRKEIKKIKEYCMKEKENLFNLNTFIKKLLIKIQKEINKIMEYKENELEFKKTIIYSYETKIDNYHTIKNVKNLLFNINPFNFEDSANNSDLNNSQNSSTENIDKLISVYKYILSDSYINVDETIDEKSSNSIKEINKNFTKDISSSTKTDEVTKISYPHKKNKSKVSKDTVHIATCIEVINNNNNKNEAKSKNKNDNKKNLTNKVNLKNIANIHVANNNYENNVTNKHLDMNEEFCTVKTSYEKVNLKQHVLKNNLNNNNFISANKIPKNQPSGKIKINNLIKAKKLENYDPSNNNKTIDENNLLSKKKLSIEKVKTNIAQKITTSHRDSNRNTSDFDSKDNYKQETDFRSDTTNPQFINSKTSLKPVMQNISKNIKTTNNEIGITKLPIKQNNKNNEAFLFNKNKIGKIKGGKLRASMNNGEEDEEDEEEEEEEDDEEESEEEEDEEIGKSNKNLSPIKNIEKNNQMNNINNNKDNSLLESFVNSFVEFSNIKPNESEKGQNDNFLNSFKAKIDYSNNSSLRNSNNQNVFSNKTNNLKNLVINTDSNNTNNNLLKSKLKNKNRIEDDFYFKKFNYDSEAYRHKKILPKTNGLRSSSLFNFGNKNITDSKKRIQHIYKDPYFDMRNAFRESSRKSILNASIYSNNNNSINFGNIGNISLNNSLSYYDCENNILNFIGQKVAKDKISQMSDKKDFLNEIKSTEKSIDKINNYLSPNNNKNDLINNEEVYLNDGKTLNEFAPKGVRLTIRELDNSVCSLVELDVNHFVCGFLYGEIDIYDTNELSCLLTINEHKARVNYLFLLKDKCILSSSFDNTMKKIKFLENSKTYVVEFVFSSYENIIYKGIELVNNEIVSISFGGQISFWNKVSNKSYIKHKEYKVNDEEIYDMLELIDNELVISTDESLKFFDILTYKNTHTINDMKFAHKNNNMTQINMDILGVLLKNEVGLINIHTKQILNKISLNEKSIPEIILSMNDKTVLVGLTVNNFDGNENKIILKQFELVDDNLIVAIEKEENKKKKGNNDYLRITSLIELTNGVIVFGTSGFEDYKLSGTVSFLDY